MEIRDRSPYTTLEIGALGGAAASSAPPGVRAEAQSGAPHQAASSAADSTELSAASRAIAEAAQLPDVRQERVDGLQQQIASGTYQVGAPDVADALLRQFRS